MLARGGRQLTSQFDHHSGRWTWTRPPHLLSLPPPKVVEGRPSGLGP